MKIQEVAKNFLSCVSPRLIKEEERDRFDQLLETGTTSRARESESRHLRYVAEVDGDPDFQRRGAASQSAEKVGRIKYPAAGASSGIRY